MKSLKNPINTLVLGIIAISSLFFSCKKELFSPVDKVFEEDIQARTTSGIRRDLTWLSTSLCLAHEQLWDTLANGKLTNPISDIIYRHISNGVSQYYAISYYKLFNEAELRGIELDEMMNDIIRDLYDISDSTNITRNILLNNSHNGKKYIFHILVPYFDNIVNLTPDPITELIAITENKINILNDKKPYFSWIYGDVDYPIDGFHADLDDLIEHEINATLVYNNPVLISVFDLLPQNLYLNSEYTVIDDCFMLNNSCRECPYINTNDQLINDPSGAGAMDHEILINLAGGGTSILCYITTPEIGGVEEETPYAVLKAMPGFNYYYVTPGITTKYVRKVELPLLSVVQGDGGFQGDYLKICQSEAYFKVYGEALGGADYAIAAGGVYMLTTPGVTADPLYFSFPFQSEIWFTNGPDMELHYYHNYDGISFCDEDLSDIVSEKFTKKNDFYVNNIIDPESNKLIASTDFDELGGYWLDNFVHVGIATAGSQMIIPENLLDFEASTPTTPIVPGDIGTMIAELESYNDGTYTWYQIEGNFIDNEEFEPDTEIIVQVYATFENGEEIDQYSYLTLQPNINPYTEVKTFFRGKIVDYSIKIFNKI